MPDLDASVDCGEDTCSSLDTIGCRLIPHEEVERQFNDAIKRLPSKRYVGFMNNLQQNYPRTYRFFRAFGF